MIIEIPDDNSIVKWKMNDKDEWKSAEISDLIIAYEVRLKGDAISREALKANMKKAEEQADTFEMLVEFYEQIIDNAPTVSDQYEEGYAQGYIDGSTGADWIGDTE